MTEITDTVLANQKILRAFMNLGVSFADCCTIIEFDPETPTACWTYNTRTGDEQILVGPRVAALSVKSIEMVLRHEILHRSLFHGFHECYNNKELCNLVLDVCINRLLFEAYGDDMRDLCKDIYPPESKKSLVALADPTANPKDLKREWWTLWNHIWRKNAKGKLNQLNPASLYFKLLELTGPKDLEDLFIIGNHSDGMADKSLPGPPYNQVLKGVCKDLSKHLPKGSGTGAALEEYSAAPLNIGENEVDKFIRRMQVKKIARATAAKVIPSLDDHGKVQPYLMYPTRMGMIYEACGLSDVFSLYWNKDVTNKGGQMAIGMYMDVSASMSDKYGVVMHFIDTFREHPLKLAVFDTSVREVKRTELDSHSFRGGGGTDFNEPIRDMVEDNRLCAGVLFTDGEASVDAKVGRLLFRSRKRLYVVYLLDRAGMPHGNLERYAYGSVSLVCNEL